ncbi:MAG TPA: M48 family metalloprotease [Paraburkholderia sp.]
MKRAPSFKFNASRAALRAACALGFASSLALVMPSSAYAATSAASAAAPAAATTPATATGAATAPTAKSAAATAAAANADSATAATPNSAPTATNPTSSPNAGSAPVATPPSAAPQAQPPVTAKTPAATSAPASPPPYTPNTSNTQLRYGDYLVFRNLIPSPMLEAQAAEEFEQIAYGAEHAKRLYGDTDAHVTRVRSIVERMIPYSLKWNERAKGWKWDVAVVRSTDIRMYCLPGGKIVVYGGLLDRLRLNDNELGMLIGHEIAHALREHARERLGQLQASQLDSSGTIPQLFGLADLGAAPLGIGSRLLEMKYESTDETEADVIGSDIASRAGFDPRAAVTLWDKLAQATRGDRDRGFIYVHPYTPARRQDIIKRLPDMLPLYAKAIGTTVDALPDYAGIGRPRRKTAAD